MKRQWTTFFTQLLRSLPCSYIPLVMRYVKWKYNLGHHSEGAAHLWLTPKQHFKDYRFMHRGGPSAWRGSGHLHPHSGSNHQCCCHICNQSVCLQIQYTSHHPWVWNHSPAQNGHTKRQKHLCQMKHEYADVTDYSFHWKIIVNTVAVSMP